jgi:ribonuclease PH
VRKLREKGFLAAAAKSPIKAQFAAISVGIVNGKPVLDLDYVEDKDAQTDMNVVMTTKGQFIEVQASGRNYFSAYFALHLRVKKSLKFFSFVPVGRERY